MISLSPATRRNTPAHYVNVCGVNILFSYETAVGCNPPDEVSFRRRNVWGPTTGKHLNETGFRNVGIEELEEDEFEVRMNKAILRAIGNRMANHIGV
jgi:hypothetical protein